MEFKLRNTGDSQQHSNYDQISEAIIRQQHQIQENLKLRNEKYNQCMSEYLQHLKKEIHDFESTEKQNNKRNQLVSQTYQTAYDRILSSAQISMRKIKQTCFQKKQFWHNLIKNNADLSDIELKKDFYQQKRDAQDRYFESVSTQKIKRVPYNVLLGKISKNQSLKQWQKNNKQLEEKVYQGTKTINEWRNLVQAAHPNKYGDLVGQQAGFIQNFTQPNRGNWNSNKKSEYAHEDRNPGDFLKNFQRRA